MVFIFWGGGGAEATLYIIFGQVLYSASLKKKETRVWLKISQNW